MDQSLSSSSSSFSATPSSSIQNDNQFKARVGNKKSKSRTTRYDDSGIKSAKSRKAIYFITIPRCDLTREFIFDGFDLFCKRLIVAKEEHKLTYADSCCAHSSIVDYSQSIVTINDASSSQSGQQEQHDVDLDEFEKKIIGGVSAVEVAPRSTIKITKRQSHCNSHIHIFADFGERDYNEKEVIDILNWCTDNITGNVSRVKSESRVMRYVTKEDTLAIFKGIPTDQASMFLKLTEFIKENETFSFHNPFIASRPNYYKYIQMCHDDYWGKQSHLVKPCHGLKICTLDTDGDPIKEQIKEWYNDYIRNWHEKKKALYLYGPSDSGKTTVINKWLLQDLSIYDIHRPTRNDEFAWQKFNQNKHLVVVMDECDLRKYDIDVWKELVGGSTCEVRVKGGSSKLITIKCPIIHISNYEPLDKIGVLNRLHVIKTTKIYE